MLSFNNYKLVELNQDLEEQILSLIEKNNGSIFHEPELNRIAAKHHNTLLYYLVDDPEKIQNAAPIHITKKSFGRRFYQFKPPGDIPYAGFIKQPTNIFSDLRIGILDSVRYLGMPLPQKDDDFLTYSGLTSFVDLKLTESEIFENVINSKRRNMIRKAIKTGIYVVVYDNIFGFQAFWPMMEQLHVRLGYNSLKKEYYEELFNFYSKIGKAVILVAYNNFIPLSGVFLLSNSNYTYYYKGASAFGVKNEGQGELLQWEAIRWAKDKSLIYDLCNLNKNKLPEIYRFKTGISNNLLKYEVFKEKSFLYKFISKISRH